MRNFEVLVKDLEGRFARLRQGQVIEERNLSLAGYNVEQLIAEGKVRDTAVESEATEVEVTDDAPDDAPKPTRKRKK